MASTNSQVIFRHGTAANYAALSKKDASTLYFCTDTKQIFLGDSEYTKGATVLATAPTEGFAGDHGKLYVYNGNIYLYQLIDGSNVWTRVANVNDKMGTVTSVGAGDGLDTTASSDNPITTTGTIVHAIPTGAAVTNDSIADQTLEFGETFNIVGLTTDKFGHVTGVTLHTVALPEETPVTIVQETQYDSDSAVGETISIVTDVTVGDTPHEIKKVITQFRIPGDGNTTYTISAGAEDGTILVTPSEGSAYTVAIGGWDDLAKQSDLTKLFKFQGTVATVADLPETSTEGHVYHVTADATEYVYAIVGDDATPTWEPLGGLIDLSAYAKMEQVVPRVIGATGNIAKFNADGTISSTGFTLGTSVPADAKFTDTVYEHATHTAAASGFYKVTVDGEGHVTGVTAVTAADINALQVTATSAASADKATADSEGNNIAATYATKAELETASGKLLWETF